jgi:dolichyl-diphosphooligosaccharide--protein glycosyltransferase/undecaprenyl-diphosphooligosaccharide--protein glycosyltransferase
VASAIFLMFFNILRINLYIKPKYFLNQEIQILNKLNFKKGDSLISWWDYGWPLWYYTGERNTYIDNGNNTRGGTVFVSKMLLSPAQETYKLAKIISTKTKDLSILKSQASIDNKANSIKNKDTYILLHKNMLNIFSTLTLFSDRDILTGNITQKQTFVSSFLQDKNQNYIKTDKFKIDIKKGIIIDLNNNIGKLYGIINLEDNKRLDYKRYYDNSKFLIIIAEKRIFYMDIETFNSFLIQSILLDRTNSQLFKDVSNSSDIKILKLR